MQTHVHGPDTQRSALEHAQITVFIVQTDTIQTSHIQVTRMVQTHATKKFKCVVGSLDIV